MYVKIALLGTNLLFANIFNFVIILDDEKGMFRYTQIASTDF